MARKSTRAQTSKGKATRPILTYVNGDVSWLVSFPRPAPAPAPDAKVYYHVLVDPWNGQSARLMAGYLIDMQAGRKPAMSGRADVDGAIVEIEAGAGHTLAVTDDEPAVDAILILGQAPDHCHPESLRDYASATPVFTVAAAVSTIQSLNHFTKVVAVPALDPGTTPWKQGHPGAPFPEWLTAFPLSVSRFNNFGWVIITSADAAANEVVLMAPHGIGADEASVRAFAAAADPPTELLALVAPLKDSYTFGMQTVLGVRDGLGIAQEVPLRYYVRSGDFVSLKYGGFIGYFVNDVQRDMAWGVEELKKKLGPDQTIKEPQLVELDNGGRFVLE